MNTSTNPPIKITLFQTSASGSNNHHLFNNVPESLSSKYQIELLTMEEARMNPNLDRSDVYITTHGEYPSNHQKINIELWHGFPLKAMAKMDRQETVSDDNIYRYWNHVDVIASYSPLYTTALNACNGANIKQYQITGMPRNDALFSEDSKSYLNKLFPNLKERNDKILFFMPTFRQSIITPEKKDGVAKTDNIFGLSDFNMKEFLLFLEHNEITLIIKLHPFEEAYFKEYLEQLKSNRIYILNDSHLANHQIDLYTILGAADILITDYSSVYIDYLLLDRPVLFIPTDLEEYRNTRGFLLEPYDFWTPGSKVHSQSQLQSAVEEQLTHSDLYAHERAQIKSLCHTYTDNQSSIRLWNFIDYYIESRLEAIQNFRSINEQQLLLKNEIKDKIKQMIDQGYLAQANSAINEYLQTNDADSDIFAMNGILHILTNNPHEALETFKKGNQYFPWDADLLYNIGYVYESLNEKQLALNYFKEALQQCKNPDLENLIQDKISAFE